MAYIVNGQRIPETLSCPEVFGCAGGKTRSEEIAEFIKNDLPSLCDDRATAGNAVINISVSLYYGVDAVFTDQKVSGTLLHSTQPLGVTRRRRLYVSHNYLAQRQSGKWNINPLLVQDEWLWQNKVQKAFEKIVRMKDWNETIEMPLLCECSIDGISTVAWISRVDAGEQWHTLCCLPQNGLIMIDRTEDEFPITGGVRIKVADCNFRPNLSKGEITYLTKI